MSHPMTPIELFASAFSLIATFAVFWWVAGNLIRLAVEIYARCRPMREKNQEADHG